MSEEKAFWTHEISSLLGVSDSTLRKWCLALEKHGYVFTRGKNNSRAFLVRDRDILLELKHSIRTTGLTLEKASYQLLNEFNSTGTNGLNDSRSSVPEVVRESFERELKSINERLNQQDEINSKILKQLERQEQRQAERDQNLMQAINQSLETQKQLAAAKQKPWWKFWK